jgi:hypothetical protein
MLQRIQTVYLFFAAVFIFSMFFSPLVEIVDADDTYYRYDLFGIHQGLGETARLTMPVFPLRFLVFVAGALSVFIIFLYRRRILQIRLCIFNIVLNLGFYALFFFYFHHATRDIEAATYFKLPVVFPVVAIIFLYLALRNIGKDEILVRSYNRIR